MQKVISAGLMQMKASCGLLALNNEERSKVNIKIEIVAGGRVCKTLTLTSNKVSSNSSVYEPDWVETSLVMLPTNTEKLFIYLKAVRRQTEHMLQSFVCLSQQCFSQQT